MGSPADSAREAGPRRLAPLYNTLPAALDTYLSECMGEGMNEEGTSEIMSPEGGLGGALGE